MTIATFKAPGSFGPDDQSIENILVLRPVGEKGGRSGIGRADMSFDYVVAVSNPERGKVCDAEGRGFTVLDRSGRGFKSNKASSQRFNWQVLEDQVDFAQVAFQVDT